MGGGPEQRGSSLPLLKSELCKMGWGGPHSIKGSQRSMCAHVTFTPSFGKIKAASWKVDAQMWATPNRTRSLGKRPWDTGGHQSLQLAGLFQSLKIDKPPGL